MEHFPKDVIWSIVWYMEPKQACILSGITKHYFHAIGDFAIYWFHHTKIAKDKNYLTRRIHNPKFTVRCVKHGRTNGACYNFLKKHLPKERFMLIDEDLRSRHRGSFRFGDYEWIPYIELFESLGLECNNEWHNTIITKLVHSWKDVSYEKPKRDPWFTVFRKIYFNKEKAKVKRIQKQIESTNYLHNLKEERDMLRYRLQEVESSLYYANNLPRLQKDIDESSFAQRTANKGPKKKSLMHQDQEWLKENYPRWK